MLFFISVLLINYSRNLNVKYPNILSLKCSVHVLNSLVKDLMKIPSVNQVIKNALKLVNFITSSHIWTNHMRKHQKEYNISHFLQTFSESRFFSIKKVLSGVVLYDGAFLAAA